MAKEKTREQVEAEANELVNQEIALAEQQQVLVANNPELEKFLQEQKRFKEQSDLFWETIKNEMIRLDIKKINLGENGEGGHIRIDERTNYKAPDLSKVPAKFVKKALDTPKITAAIKLDGKAPKGIEVTKTKTLVRKIKKLEG